MAVSEIDSVKCFVAIKQKRYNYKQEYQIEVENIKKSDFEYQTFVSNYNLVSNQDPYFFFSRS